MKRFGLALALLAGCTGAFAQTPATSPSPKASATPVATATPTKSATPAPTTTPAGMKTLSVAAYRALLQGALDSLKKVEKRPPVNARPILKPLDATITVKRDDGQTQTVRGDDWNRWLSGVYGNSPTKMTRPEASELEALLQGHITALDEWTTKRNGAYYASFDAQKVIRDAVASGQIRVAPPAYQLWLANAQDAVSNAWVNFWKWVAGLFPTPKAPATGPNLPNLSWLWFVFWAVLLGLLGLLIFFVVRALSGGSFSLWGIGKRRKKSEVELRDEDAALFQLAPDELRDRADAFAASGNFREALRHRFISVLVLLDARGTWRYDIRRTNWEHIAGLRRDESKRPLVAPLSNLTRAFDRVRYGGAPCDEEGWNEFQSGVREVESLVGGKAQRLEVAR